MSKMTLPLGSSLRDGYDETDAQRIWRGILARSARSTSEPWSARWIFYRGALAVAGVMVVLSFWLGRPWGHSRLELSTGEPPSTFVVGSEQSQRQVDFADGSKITLGSGSRLDVLANDGSSFVTVLRHGRGSFAVRPGGPRRWVVECGLATVEVVGTDFSVQRSAERLEVVVSHGTVAVRGDKVPDGGRALTAGERLVVGDENLERAANPEPSVITAPSASSQQCAPAPGNGTIRAIGSPSSKSPVTTAARAHVPIEELLGQADAARKSGDIATAADLLERTAREAGRDPRAAVAALTLARLTMTSYPQRVARVLSSVLAIGVPRGLEEDTSARLVEARARSGDKAGARRAAVEYERRFPAGARLEEVRRWTAE
jgi:transmembrane sensor